MMARLLLFILLFGGCTAKQDSTTNKRPNILFIFTDDHALQAIGAYGSVLNKTPNIDRLAAEGMIFRNAFCTNSICAPSRAVIQTGKHSHLNGVIDNIQPFDSAQPTFPKLLQKGGYQTAMIGKWHLKSEPVGFDYWKVLPGQGEYYNPDFRTPEGLERIEGYTTDIVTDLSIEWLEEGWDKSKPFMLMLQQKAPHRPWYSGPDHLRMYEDVTFPEPDNLFDDYTGRASGAPNQEMEIDRHMALAWDLKITPVTHEDSLSEKRYFNRINRFTDKQLQAWNAVYGPINEAFRNANLQGKELVRWKYQRYLRDYLKCIASVDYNIGRILQFLKSNGLDQNTAVAYSSDQGFYLGEHGWFDKRWMYEESLHMPLIIKWPGVINSGSSNDLMVQNLDFAPTFLDMAGLPIPEDMQGHSLMPLLRNEVPNDWRTSIYYHYYEYPGAHQVPRHNGVRTERYKLINYYQLGEKELFDLQSDPSEMNNLYDDPAHATIRQQLEDELLRLKDFYQDHSID
jgi:arylsulfatase A-like enzyme